MATGRGADGEARGGDLRREPSASPPSALEPIRRRLLGWYDEHQRDLPWRQTRDPYAILVSEVMLQQTQVDRVIPKYHEFLARFPTFEALAAADRASVIDAWIPLGYNRRAVSLHEIARAVCERGGLPRSQAELAKLRGLGPYTSAAVACFAFGQQIVAIDTNVRRVLSRLIDPQADTESLAREALPVGRAEDWNQALMDLGATICTARSPACWRCPVGDLCAARADLQSARPRPSARAAEGRGQYRAEPPFVGSSRYYRGLIVRTLRDRAREGAVVLDELGGAIRDDFAPELRPWLIELLRALERDGLVRTAPPDAPGDAGELTVRLA